MIIRFTKMEGCGNDYVYINGISQTIPEDMKPSLVRKMSDRHFGIGGDGVIFINSSEIADFEMEMYNADGSRGEMCGNGIRCVGKFVYDYGLTDQTQITVESFKKIKYLTLYPENGYVKRVKVNMGPAILESSEIPVLYSEEEGRFVAMHHPFTMPMEEDVEFIESDPGRCRAKAYDIVLNGTEIGGGSVRIHQDDIQEKMFRALGFTDEEADEKFGFLINAFKYGVPPHAGLAYGLDRLVMHMVGEDNIRDVIAFPKVKDASCLMSEAPNVVDQKQLDELYIKSTYDPEKKDEDAKNSDTE